MTGTQLILQVPGQLELNQGVIHGNGARHDEKIAVLSLPERMNDRRHRAQHAACPLELVERGPVVVKTVEQFRMDRVGHLYPPFVVCLPAFIGELLDLGCVEFRKGPRHGIAGHVVVAAERLKQPAAHDLKAFVRAGRPPGRFHPADGVFQASQGFAPRSPPTSISVTASLGLLVRAFRGGNAHDEQRVLGSLGRFAQRLGEGKVRLKRAGRQVGRGVQLASVGNPFVDQDETRAVLVE